LFFDDFRSKNGLSASYNNSIADSDNITFTNTNNHIILDSCYFAQSAPLVRFSIRFIRARVWVKVKVIVICEIQLQVQLQSAGNVSARARATFSFTYDRAE
jgi:hypothetical protein